MKRFFAILAFAVVATAGADWLTGTWKADIHGEAKTFPVVFHFKLEANDIHGSIEFPSHDLEFPITHGTVRGNEVSFVGAGLWHGTLKGKGLELTRELDGGKKQVMVATRTPH